MGITAGPGHVFADVARLSSARAASDSPPLLRIIPLDSRQSQRSSARLQASTRELLCVFSSAEGVPCPAGRTGETRQPPLSEEGE
ncbi:hypothetical protein NDU88_008161 [Pleurodeles waltl]|uniref:Uncharacterized protein n=1 Tax=Pleurodeles waltl TaxID=8319 RepID=A0AAV7PNQ2_PLEWA|nr:hypothetical protein NDU88_008161 [Pleurodeles waltl]